MVQPGEACDDGNADDDDGCLPTCEPRHGRADRSAGAPEARAGRRPALHGAAAGVVPRRVGDDRRPRAGGPRARGSDSVAAVRGVAAGRRRPGVLGHHRVGRRARAGAAAGAGGPGARGGRRHDRHRGAAAGLGRAPVADQRGRRRLDRVVAGVPRAADRGDRHELVGRGHRAGRQSRGRRGRGVGAPLRRRGRVDVAARRAGRGRLEHPLPRGGDRGQQRHDLRGGRAPRRRRVLRSGVPRGADARGPGAVGGDAAVADARARAAVRRDRDGPDGAGGGDDAIRRRCPRGQRARLREVRGGRRGAAVVEGLGAARRLGGPRRAGRQRAVRRDVHRHRRARGRRGAHAGVPHRRGRGGAVDDEAPGRGRARPAVLRPAGAGLCADEGRDPAVRELVKAG
ncbi:hypothetical protein [Nannocystis pusilla]|uniref:hypothetical protein n=1 Tax=Nannocystis pusilla TaxID=889268 RepID=UPI003DA3FEC8